MARRVQSRTCSFGAALGGSATEILCLLYPSGRRRQQILLLGNPREPESWASIARIAMLIISLALAASGILTCGLALSDIFLPRGSALAVLALIPLLGRSRIWRVDHLRMDLRTVGPRGWLRVPTRTARKASKPSQIVSIRGPNPASIDERPPEPKTAVPLRPLIDYPVRLRGTMRFQGTHRVSGRHGQ